jgi:IS30 family transposase
VLRLTPQQKLVIAERAAEGVPSRQIAREIGRAHRTVHDYVAVLRQRPARRRCRSSRQLSLPEREEISRGLAEGRSLRGIAAGLGRSPSTVCREVSRNGGRRRYRAARAEDRALAEGRRPKTARLAADAVLRALVEDQLGWQWSPQQIAGWLRDHLPVVVRAGPWRVAQGTDPRVASRPRHPATTSPHHLQRARTDPSRGPHLPARRTGRCLNIGRVTC